MNQPPGMFPVSCRRCKMQFKTNDDLQNHLTTAHAEELGLVPPTERYVQSVFTPKDFEIIDCLVTLGLCWMHEQLTGPTVITTVSRMKAIASYSQATSAESKSALKKLSQIAHTDSGIGWDEAQAIVDAKKNPRP